MAELWTVEQWDAFLPPEPEKAASANGHHTGARAGARRVDALSALEPVIEHCDFVRWCRDHQPDVPEPLWHALLSNLSRCEGGREAAHAFSRDDPRYTARETDEKFEHAQRGSKPITCARIQELGFGGCPPAGHGVRAPVGLGWPGSANSEPAPETPPAPESKAEPQTIRVTTLDEILATTPADLTTRYIAAPYVPVRGLFVITARSGVGKSKLGADLCLARVSGGGGSANPSSLAPRCSGRANRTPGGQPHRASPLSRPGTHARPGDTLLRRHLRSPAQVR
jgi:hypothetical protein